MTTILRWSRCNTWLTHGKRTGSNSNISIPRERMLLRWRFCSGWLLESLPNPSNSARTSTPSFAFSARMSNRSDAIESLRKLKYSRWTLLRAWRMAWNISSNFSWPLISSVTLLLCENFTPSSSNWFTMSESLVWADTSAIMHRQAIKAIIIDLTLITYI